jgi:hypothetical protein
MLPYAAKTVDSDLTAVPQQGSKIFLLNVKDVRSVSDPDPSIIKKK